MHLLKTRTHLAGQGFKLLLSVVQQGFHRNGHHHTVKGAIATSPAQQLEQRAPGAAIDVGIWLGQVTASGVDQHAVIGKIPVTVTGTEGIAGQFSINFVDRKLKPREVEQTGFATALGANQQVQG